MVLNEYITIMGIKIEFELDSQKNESLNLDIKWGTAFQSNVQFFFLIFSKVTNHMKRCNRAYKEVILEKPNHVKLE